jgi:hypothetical protein
MVLNLSAVLYIFKINVKLRVVGKESIVAYDSVEGLKQKIAIS